MSSQVVAARKAGIETFVVGLGIDKKPAVITSLTNIVNKPTKDHLIIYKWGQPITIIDWWINILITYVAPGSTTPAPTRITTKKPGVQTKITKATMKPNTNNQKTRKPART